MAQPFVDPCARGVIRAQPCPRALGIEIPSPRRRLVLAACILASSMAFIDGSALTVALPKLRTALGADLATVQWVLNSYVLALAALTLVGGALADTYGKARMLTIGCFLFGTASAGCGLAASVEWLIALRVMQGIAAALMTPASLALIGATYPRDERTAAIGIWAGASALTTAAGPVLGGWLTENFGWQAVFWINPPLAVLAIVLLLLFAPADRRERRRFDFVGACLIASALGVLTWALSQIGRGESRDGAAPASDTMMLAAFALGFAGICGYAAWERASSSPMTPPRLAGNRDFVGLNLATLLIYAGLSVMFFLVPFDLIDRRGLSPTSAGLAFLPLTLGVGLLSPFFGGLMATLGARAMLIAGAIGAAVAYVWMMVAHNVSIGAGVIAPMTVLGISFAVLVTPLTAAVMSSVAQSDEGLASGVNNAAARVAQLAGVAIAAGLGSLAAGYQLGLSAAAAVSLAGALTTALVHR